MDFWEEGKGDPINVDPLGQTRETTQNGWVFVCFLQKRIQISNCASIGLYPAYLSFKSMSMSIKHRHSVIV